MKKKKKSAALVAPPKEPAPPPPQRTAPFGSRRTIVVSAAILVLALVVTRFYSLESQGFHHDESIHCLHSWRIANNGAQTYKYNPVFHGPFLYHFGGLFHSFARPQPIESETSEAPVYQSLLPDEDWVGRLPYATIGTLFPLLFFLLHKRLGWGTVLLIVALIALSPVVNYFSRFARNDVYMTAWLTGIVVFGHLYFSSRKSLYLTLVGLFAALAYCTKENSYINTFVPCSFVILWGMVAMVRSPRKSFESICLDYAPCVRFLTLFGCFSVFVFLFVAIDSRIGPETGLVQGLRNILAHSTALTEKIDASALKGETGYFTAPERESTQSAYYRLAFGLTTLLLIAQEIVFFFVRRRARPTEPVAAHLMRGAFAILFILALAWSAVDLAGWTASVERDGFLTALFTRMAVQAAAFGVLALLFVLPVRMESSEAEAPPASVAREKVDWWSLALTAILAQTLYLFLFTSMGTNIQRGASAGLYDYIAYWFKHQTGDFRIWGAWWYYLPRLLLYELLPLLLVAIAGSALALQGLRALFRRRASAESQREPSPSTILASTESTCLFWKPIPKPLLGYAVYQFLFMAGIYAVLNEKVPWLMTYQSFSLGLLAALLIGHYFATHPNTPGPFRGFFWDLFSPPPGFSRWARIGRSALVAVVFLLIPFSVGQHLTAVYLRPDHPTELLLYTGTTNQFAGHIERIRGMREEARAEKRNLSIAVEGKAEWPSAWYFRNDDVRWKSVDLSREVQILDDTGANRERMKPIRGNVWEIHPCDLRGWWIWHGTPTALPGRLALIPNIRAFLFNEPNDQRASFPPSVRPKEEDYAVGFRTQILRYVFRREIWHPSAGEKILVCYRTDEVVSAEEAAGRLEGAADPPRHLAPARVWGVAGSEVAEFVQPRGMAFDSKGLLAVADSKNGRIRILDPDGKMIRTVGEGVLSPEVTGPCGVAFDATGNLYVTDTWNHSIKKFSEEGTLLASFERVVSGRVQTRLFGPRGIEVSPDGRVFVTDTGNHCVRIFDSDLRLLQTWGGPGSEPGQFKEPVGIAVDPEGKVYVADTGNGRIQYFDSDGLFLAEFFTLLPAEHEVSSLEPNLALLPDGRLAFSHSREDAVWIIDPAKMETKKYTISPPRLRGPVGLAAAPNGRLWVGGRDSGTICEARIP